MYSTSHLFFLGDLNFRLSLPTTHALSGPNKRPELAAALDSSSGREGLKEYDQLLMERRRNNVFQGFREGEFWRFKCTYKYSLGEVDRYRSVSLSSSLSF